MPLQKPKTPAANADAPAAAAAAKEAAPQTQVADDTVTGSSIPDALDDGALHDQSDPYAAGLELDDEALRNAPAVIPQQQLVPMPGNGRGLSNVAPQKIDDGFDGLEQEVGFGSYPILKLDKMMFIIGDKKIKGDDGVKVILISARKKYLFKASKDRKTLLAYSYDGRTGTDGRALQDHFAEWIAEGKMAPGASPVVSRYFEAPGVILDTGDPNLDGEIVLLSIPPASVSRLAGIKQRLDLNGLKMGEVVLRCGLGPMVEKNGETFYPWDFKIVAKAHPSMIAAIPGFDPTRVDADDADLAR